MRDGAMSMDDGHGDQSSGSERGRVVLVLSIPFTVVAVTVVVALMGRMELIPVHVGVVGAVYGLALAVYDGITERGSGNEEWGWALIIYPFLGFLPLWFVGLLILALYNLAVHGRFALNL